MSAPDDTLEVVGFIDLLGTKESVKSAAQTSGEESASHFRSMLSEFFYIVAGLADRFLRQSLALYIFGDCAYIGGVLSRSDFIRFCRIMRAELLGKGVFFKCAFRLGRLEPIETIHVDSKDPIQQRIHQTLKALEEKNAQVKVQYFGLDSVKAYFDHELFKGVGFSLSRELAEQVTRSGQPETIVQSYYPSNLAERGVVPCYDIAYDGAVVERMIADDSPYQPRLPHPEAQRFEIQDPFSVRSHLHITALIDIFRFAYGNKARHRGERGTAAEVTSRVRELAEKPFEALLAPAPKTFSNPISGVGLLRSVLRARHASALKKEEYSAYYASALITFVRSSDFRWIFHDNGQWNFYPFVFLELFLTDEDRSRSFGYVGREAVMLSLADAVLSALESREMLLKAIAFVDLDTALPEPLSEVSSAIACTQHTMRQFVRELMDREEIVKALRSPQGRVLLRENSADVLRQIHSEMTWGEVTDGPSRS